jgi:hypothetical protein
MKNRIILCTQKRDLNSKFCSRLRRRRSVALNEHKICVAFSFLAYFRGSEGKLGFFFSVIDLEDS